METALVLASRHCMTGFEVSRWEEWETRERFPSPGEIAPDEADPLGPATVGAAISPGRRFPRARGGAYANQSEAGRRTGSRSPRGGAEWAHKGPVQNFVC